MSQKSRRLVVKRVSSRSGDRFFYFDGGQRIEMGAELALEGAKRRQVTIQTVGDRKCPAPR